eukprot:864799-Amphidinium_carterae.2
MYRRFNPEKLKEIDILLDKYRDNEAELYQALCDKYIPTIGEGDPPLEFDVWASPSSSSSSCATDAENDEVVEIMTPLRKESPERQHTGKSPTLPSMGVAGNVQDEGRISSEHSRSPEVTLRPNQTAATAMARSKAHPKRRPYPSAQGDEEAVPQSNGRSYVGNETKSPSPLKRRKTAPDPRVLAAAELRPKARPKPKPPPMRHPSPIMPDGSEQLGAVAASGTIPVVETVSTPPVVQEKRRKKRRKQATQERENAEAVAGLLLSWNPAFKSPLCGNQNQKRHTKESYTKDSFTKRKFQIFKNCLNPRKIPKNRRNKKWETSVFEDNSFTLGVFSFPRKGKY